MVELLSRGHGWKGLDLEVDTADRFESASASVTTKGHGGGGCRRGWLGRLGIDVLISIAACGGLENGLDTVDLVLLSPNKLFLVLVLGDILSEPLCTKGRVEN